jgi:NADPH2:quinone reductase
VSNRAVVIREFGELDGPQGPVGIDVEERPDAVGGADGEIEVELLAADLQPLDRQIARGFLPGSGPLPMVAGVSAVGRTVGSGRPVVVLGEVTGRGIGRDGLFADRFVAAAHQVSPCPTTLDPRAVAAGAVLGMHARHTLFEVARVRPEHVVLVLGANGGFGHAVMSTAHSEGLRVIAAARRPDHVDAPEGVPVLGLDDLAALAPAVKDLTGGHGADVIVDPLGGAVTGAAVRAGARACRHVLLGHASGAEASIPVPAMMLGEHRLLGVNGFLIDISDQHAYLREALVDMALGHHRPRIGAVYDLAEARDAYARAGSVDGRSILVGAALGDATTAVDHPEAALAPAPGRHDHHHGTDDEHDHADGGSHAHPHPHQH